MVPKTRVSKQPTVKI